MKEIEENNKLIRVSHSEDCPSNDYTPGVAVGKCWGDGHYECVNCIHYRSDFKRHGQDYIDFAHTSQSGLRIAPMV